MSAEADDWMPPISHAPASAAVYQRVRSRIRSLRDLRQFGQGHKNLKSVLPRAPVELRELEQRQFPSPLHTSRLASMSEEIACIELLSEIRLIEGEKMGDRILENKRAGLMKEKWAWGFRGNGIWTKLREEWMNSGVVRRG